MVSCSKQSRAQCSVRLAGDGRRNPDLALSLKLHPVIRCRAQLRARALDGAGHDPIGSTSGERGAWVADHVAGEPATDPARVPAKSDHQLNASSGIAGAVATSGASQIGRVIGLPSVGWKASGAATLGYRFYGGEGGVRTWRCLRQPLLSCGCGVSATVSKNLFIMGNDKAPDKARRGGRIMLFLIVAG
jgi:hypothetical protein